MTALDRLDLELEAWETELERFWAGVAGFGVDVALAAGVASRKARELEIESRFYGEPPRSRKEVEIGIKRGADEHAKIGRVLEALDAEREARRRP